MEIFGTISSQASGFNNRSQIERPSKKKGEKSSHAKETFSKYPDERIISMLLQGYQDSGISQERVMGSMGSQVGLNIAESDNDHHNGCHGVRTRSLNR